MNLIKLTVNIIILAVLCQCAFAAPHSQPAKPSKAVTAKPSLPYILVTSLGENWNNSYTGLPMITVMIINPTQNTLAFFSIQSQVVHFQVEYKPFSKNVSSPEGWNMVQSATQPSEAQVSDHPKVRHGSSVSGKILPKQQSVVAVGGVDCPLAAEGFYRITSFLSVPKATEIAMSPVGPSVPRKFDLELRSDSIIIRHDPGKFSAVSISANK